MAKLFSSVDLSVVASVQKAIANVLVPMFMIFGPLIGYVPQYRQIAAAKDICSFSVSVCFILLTANILRMYYWIGERFDLTLLLQSIMMILIQLIMLQLVRLYLPVHYPRKASVFRFWEWTDYKLFSTGTKYIVLAMLAVTLVNVQFLNWRWIVEWTGFLALFIEATLPLPQFIQNSRARSVKGLSLTLILTWFFGDAFKTGYYYYNASPTCFMLCGCFQLFIDSLILLQFVVFSRSRSNAYRKLLQGPNLSEDHTQAIRSVTVST